MLKKTLVAVTALAGLAAAPAFADNGWHHGHYKHFRHGRPVVYVAPRPVVVPPAPVVYAPPPAPIVYYPAPAPVYYPSASVRVVPAPGVSVRLNLPL